MSSYLDLSTRMAIVFEMLQPIPERKWGQVTAWARTYNVSRTLLYQLRDRALEALAVELLKELAHPEVRAFARLDDEHTAFILWAWRHRDALPVDIIATEITEPLRSTARVAWHILGLFHRSSSLAESLHSWLRPYLQAHRGMPKWLLPLLQLWWNHHEFERGKRAGESPLRSAGVEDAPTMVEVLAQLLQPKEAAQAI